MWMARLNTDVTRTSLDHRRGCACQKYARSAVQGSPQRRKIYVGEVGVLPQLPVCVVCHPGIILWLPVEAEEKLQWILWRNGVECVEATYNAINANFLRGKLIHLNIKVTWRTSVDVWRCSLPALSASLSAAVQSSVSAPLQPPGSPPPAVCQRETQTHPLRKHGKTLISRIQI